MNKVIQVDTMPQKQQQKDTYKDITGRHNTTKTTNNTRIFKRTPHHTRHEQGYKSRHNTTKAPHKT